MSNDSSVVRLASALRQQAATLQPGDQLPPSREIVTRHGVSPVTVSRAIARLTAEGTVVTEPGRGTFVARRHAPVEDVGWQTVALGDARVDSGHLGRLLEVPPPGTLVLSSGYLADDLQPTRFLATAAARAARRPGAWGRVPPAGLSELRAAFAATAGVDAGDVTVVAGGQSGLSAAFRALSPPGQPVLLEAPTYMGAVAAAQAADLRPVPVPTDHDGLRPDLLAEAFARTGAGLVYTQPTFANPTGTVLAASRRQEVLDVVRAAGAFLVEDDWARHLALDGTAPPPLLRDDRNGHVVYLTSLTKPVAPSLRVGALVARGPAAGRLAAIRRAEDLFIARPLQEVAVELFGSPDWPRHLTALRAALRERRDALVAAIRRDLPSVEITHVPAGGLHVWVRLPAGADDVEVADRARRRDVVVEPGRPYFVAEPPAPHLRLTYAAATPAELTEATRRLAQEIP
ncbi:PLP-dependent aminotransferase family protein [Actinophytocola sp.]|uniref:aminotransferase-like domain-containing protein n=1 Tax=Actinophytocola sp. TaxID=1872138 RepID=UPI002ED25721